MGMLAALLFLATGCVATVPLESAATDAESKRFQGPSGGMAGVYIFRVHTYAGCALKKTVSVDHGMLGETAPGTYFYTEVEPGSHLITTQAEFDDVSIRFEAEEGELYFFEQHIVMGVVVWSADIRPVHAESGKTGVRSCRQARALR